MTRYRVRYSTRSLEPAFWQMDVTVFVDAPDAVSAARQVEQGSSANDQRSVWQTVPATLHMEAAHEQRRAACAQWKANVAAGIPNGRGMGL